MQLCTKDPIVEYKIHSNHIPVSRLVFTCTCTVYYYVQPLYTIVHCRFIVFTTRWKRSLRCLRRCDVSNCSHLYEKCSKCPQHISQQIIGTVNYHYGAKSMFKNDPKTVEIRGNQLEQQTRAYFLTSNCWVEQPWMPRGRVNQLPQYVIMVKQQFKRAYVYTI